MCEWGGDCSGVKFLTWLFFWLSRESSGDSRCTAFNATSALPYELLVTQRTLRTGGFLNAPALRYANFSVRSMTIVSETSKKYPNARQVPHQRWTHGLRQLCTRMMDEETAAKASKGTVPHYSTMPPLTNPTQVERLWASGRLDLESSYTSSDRGTENPSPVVFGAPDILRSLSYCVFSRRFRQGYAEARKARGRVLKPLTERWICAHQRRGDATLFAFRRDETSGESLDALAHSVSVAVAGLSRARVGLKRYLRVHLFSEGSREDFGSFTHLHPEAILHLGSQNSTQGDLDHLSQCDAIFGNASTFFLLAVR